MAQAGYTPIQLYLSTTASAVPSAGNLANGELAINITDGKLFYKDNGGVVQVLATKGAGTIGGSNTQVQYNNAGALAGSANLTFDGTTLTANALTVSNAVTLSAGTANGVAYLNGSKVLTTGNALTFDGSTFATTGNMSVPISKSYYCYTSDYGVGTPDSLGLQLFYAAGDVMRFGSRSAGTFSEQMRLTSGGLVVGSTTVPTVGSTAMLAVGNANGGTQAITQSGSIVYRTTASTSGVDCYNPNSSPIQWYTAGVSRMQLDASGNFLVGASSALVSSAGRGNITINGSTDSILAFGSAGSNTGYLYATTSGVELASIGSTYVRFSTNGSERGRFDTSGNFLVGTTTPSSATTGQVRANAFTGSLKVAVTALNTNYVIYGAINGIIVVRDDSTGGSALWLLDPNQGVIQISNNITKTITFVFSAGYWYIRQTAGSVTTNYSIVALYPSAQ